jgi:hypothetical protein
MSASLYVNSKGLPITRHSYSSGTTWDKCSRMFYLEKIKGYRRKDKSAAMAFGKCVEDSIQFFYDNGQKHESGEDEFRRLWLKHQSNEEFVYTAKEKDWVNLRDCGVQLLKLWEILAPTLPIKEPLWQANFTKEVFPGTSLAGIEMSGFTDLISKSDWNHPLLPKVAIPKGSAYRPLIVDLKTSGVEYNITPDMLALDLQLQTYAWLSGISDVAFCVLVKGIVDAFSKGTEITFLTSSEKWIAGDKGVVYKYDEETKVLLITSTAGLQKIAEVLGEIKGKGSTERKELALAQFIVDGDLTPAGVDDVTKMKIQFLAVRIKEEDIREAGQAIAKQIVEIHDASQTGVYLKRSGVRFPNNQCTYCAYRGLCTDNPRLVDDLLVQITPATPAIEEEDDWLSDMEEM